MLAKVYGCALLGIDALPVTIEVNIDNGIGYHLVGLPEFDAKRIRYIRVVQENIVWAGSNYQGMVAIETLNGDYAGAWQSGAGARFRFRRAQAPKHYYRQPQEGADLHVPDFRHQMLWEPRIRIGDSGETFSFRTSQVPGLYKSGLKGTRPTASRYPCRAP